MNLELVLTGYISFSPELLSQLSGVRRSAQQLQNVSTSSQLQELQAQLQLERQRASIIRQQVGLMNKLLECVSCCATIMCALKLKCIHKGALF